LSPLDNAGLAFFVIVLFIGVYATLFALPGTLLIFFSALIYAAATGFDRIGGQLLALLLVLSLLAEGLELVLGMAGAATFPVSKKGVAVSLVGGIVGAVLLTPRLYGLGTLVGLYLGAYTGNLLLKLLRQRALRPALRDSRGALLGRAAGTLAKGSLALVMVILTLMTLYS